MLIHLTTAFADQHETLGEHHRAAGNDSVASVHFQAADAARALILRMLDVADLEPASERISRVFIGLADPPRVGTRIPGSPHS